MKNIRDYFGNIDIYLFDQLQKGRFAPGMKILDAGAGGGRNIIYFMREGFDVFAVDQNAEAVEQVKYISKVLETNLPPENFQTSTVEQMPFPDNYFDWVFSNAVLHFANNKAQFDAMLNEMWRTLKPFGTLFVRLASNIGIEHIITPTGSGRYDLPDGSERFLVDENMLLDSTERLGGELIEPIKTTNVQNLRCMTTWVVNKSG